MNPLNLLIASLAVWEAVEIWRHSALMSGLRARAELLEGWFGKVLNCPFCLSVWLAILATPFALDPIVPTKFPAEEPVVWAWYSVRNVGYMLMCAFAIARLANLGNDLTHGRCRTPKANKLELDAVRDDPKTTFEKKEEDGNPDGSGGPGGPGAEADVRPGGV